MYHIRDGSVIIQYLARFVRVIPRLYEQSAHSLLSPPQAVHWIQEWGMEQIRWVSGRSRGYIRYFSVSLLLIVHYVYNLSLAWRVVQIRWVSGGSRRYIGYFSLSFLLTNHHHWSIVRWKYVSYGSKQVTQQYYVFMIDQALRECLPRIIGRSTIWFSRFGESKFEIRCQQRTHVYKCGCFGDVDQRGSWFCCRNRDWCGVVLVMGKGWGVWLDQSSGRAGLICSVKLQRVVNNPIILCSEMVGIVYY